MRRLLATSCVLMLSAIGCGGETTILTDQVTVASSPTSAPTSSTTTQITTDDTGAVDSSVNPDPTAPPTTTDGSAPDTTQAPAVDVAAPVSFRGDGRSGRFPGPAPEETPRLAWTYRGEGAVALPVITADAAHTQDTAAVTTFDPATGEIIWSRALPTATPQTPVLSGETLIALSVPEPYEDDGGWHPGGVTELVAFDTHQGTELWRTQVESLVDVAPPAIGDDVLVVVGTGDLLWEACGDLCYPEGWVVAFDTQTGRELWRIPANSPRTVSVTEGTVVVPFDNATLTAYRLSTGEELWSTVHCTGLLGPPAIAGGRIVTVTDPAGVPFAPCRQAFDLLTGVELWSHEIEARGHRLLVLTPSAAYVADTQSLAAVDAATGQELWRIDGLVGQPTMVGRLIILDAIDTGTNAPVVVAIDPTTGREVWRLEVTGHPSFEGVTAAAGIVIRVNGSTLQAYTRSGA